MHKQLLTNWRPANLHTAAPAARRVAGKYLCPASGFYLLLNPDQTFVLGCYRDLGGRWDRLLSGHYLLDGPIVRLQLSATQQSKGFDQYETLLLHHGPDGHVQWLAQLEADAPPYSRMLRRPTPRLVRCISAAFGTKSFITSLTVGRFYAQLSPAPKADFILIINDRNRVRQYPATIFRTAD